MKISMDEIKARLREAMASLRDRLSSGRQRAVELWNQAKERFPSRPDGPDPLIEDPSLKGPKLWMARAKRELPRLADMASAFGDKAMQSLRKGGFDTWGVGATVVLSAWFLADVTALVLESYIPEPPPASTSGYQGGANQAKTVASYSGITSRNLFNSRGLIPGENQPGQPGKPGEQLDGPCTKTTLALNLLGTLITHDKIHSLATLEDRSAGEVYPVRVNDEVPSKIRILEIEPRKVCFVNLATGRREFVDLPEDEVMKSVRPSGGIQRPGGKGGVTSTAPLQYNVPRTVIDNALGDLNRVLTQARAVPHFENGVPAGYSLFQIVPGSIYDTLGLVNGDVLAGVNGEPLADPSKALEMLNELKTSKHVEINIKRDGQDRTLQYDIN
ncbi:MAG TPA: type II secretion system protein GspC [Bdellovibrionota bacterium]|jgi:general secretion pathway protein C|nr:type II secretion system protein GspC [Bdellovibrionota bacterium]